MAYLGKSIEKTMYFGAKPELFEFANSLRRHSTEAESKIWKALKKYRKKGFVFRRQHPLDIFIADFYCHQLKLVVEIDGDIHDEEDQSEYDIGRTAELSKYGIKVIRFKNNEVLDDIYSITGSIDKIISESSPSLMGEGEGGGEDYDS